MLHTPYGIFVVAKCGRTRQRLRGGRVWPSEAETSWWPSVAEYSAWSSTYNYDLAPIQSEESSFPDYYHYGWLN
ncbi:unnamed protein product [Microthlaspi erraticum]|uniref:Uncharacterized protein n=1 Tax=Microthlaspi erraticum TaxID=1685480 RepID=A0A6D2JPK4_9BRAS|nr:unnamed protein product [Microthlaspi erraticum]